MNGSEISGSTEQKTFFTRLAERRVVRWALAYFAGGWVLLEFTAFLVDNFAWPGSTVRLVLTLLAFGFLATLVIAWFHGEKGNQRVTRTEVVLLALIAVAGLATSVGVVAGRADPVAAADSPPQGSTAEILPGAAPARPTRTNPSLVVLPFGYIGPEQEAYFADGITEDIIATVSRIPNLRVISRTSAMQYKDTDKNAIQIGQELNVDLILEGRIQRQGDRVRIQAHLIDAETDRHIWTETFDREVPLEEYLTLQAEVAERVAQELSTTIRLSSLAQVDRRALQAYFQARAARREGDLDRALELLAQALQIDRSFTLAREELGRIRTELRLGAGFDVGQTDTDRVAVFGSSTRPAEPDSADATQLVEAALENLLAGDVESAEVMVRAAIRANRNYTAAYRVNALLLARSGRREEGLAQLQIAQSLDPRSPVIQTDIADMLYGLGRYREVVDLLSGLLAQDSVLEQPFYPRVTLGMAYYGLGEIDSALVHLRAAVAESEASPYQPWVLATLGYALATAGRSEEARGILARLQRERTEGPREVHPLALAYVHTGLGEIDEAITWFEQSPNMRMVPRLGRIYETVRNDPRIDQALRARGSEGSDPNAQARGSDGR